MDRKDQINPSYIDENSPFVDEDTSVISRNDCANVCASSEQNKMPEYVEDTLEANFDSESVDLDGNVGSVSLPLGDETASCEQEYESEMHRLSDEDIMGSGYMAGESSEDLLDGVLSDLRFAMSRQHSASIASLDYYRRDEADLQASAREGLQSNRDPGSNSSIQQSKRLPFWLWFAIAKCLGIKLSSTDRPIFATVLYTLTFLSAVGYILCNSWFTFYDIVSDLTKTTVITGTVSIFFSLLYVSLGIYANKLAYRLFSHKKFLGMLRLHSKTVLKMNASVVAFVLMFVFAIVNDIAAFENFENETCATISVEVIVCKLRYVMRVAFSGFAVIWNSLVACVVISVCRTHVIGIRKFMEGLELDARIYEERFMGLTQQTTSSTDRPVLEEYTWLDEDYLEELQETGLSDLDSNASVLIAQTLNYMDPMMIWGRRDRSRLFGMPSTGTDSEQGQPVPCSTEDTPDAGGSKAGATPSGSLRPGASQQRDEENSLVGGASTTENDASVKLTPIMSNTEILFRFWKIQSRLRMTSMALQRWMFSIISMIIVWLTMNLVIWLTTDPSLLDLANFFLPMALLPLLSSCFAEVNLEGTRLLKFICPTEERLEVLFVLQSAPLQMTVYGFTLSYATLTTAAFGVLLAFASKVLIQEISVPPKS